MDTMERLEGGSIGVPKGRPTCLGSGEDRAPLLLRRGQQAEGGNKVQVSRLTVDPRVGRPRATLTCTRKMH